MHGEETKVIHTSSEEKEDTAPIALGDKVKDLISGFEGITTEYTEWLYGCGRFAVVPDHLGKDETPIPEQTMDENILKVIERKKIKPEEVKGNYYRLGSKVVDKITKFSGIVIARTTCLNGNAYYTIEPETLASDGSAKKSLCFLSNRIDFIEEKPIPVSPNKPLKTTTGGPQRGENSERR